MAHEVESGIDQSAMAGAAGSGQPEILLDRVIREDVLLTAEEIARQADLALADERSPDGSTTVRWAPAQRTRISLSVRHDWRPYDQIVVPIWLPERSGCILHVTVKMATQTKGVEENDRYFTQYPLGVAARQPWSGWHDLEYGIENFLILGIPVGWENVESLTLEISAPDKADAVLLGPIRLQQRERPSGPRLTDRGLFDALDLSRPELARVRDAVSAGDVAAARRELVAYLRRREQPRSVYPLPVDGPVDLAAADRIRVHVINGQRLGKEIDWRANPIGYLEWMHAFNRHGFLRTLVTAYLTTHDEKYAAELDYLVSSWIKTTPSPVGNNGGGDPAWETLSTAVRCYAAWFDVFYACLESPSFREETLIDMVKSFYHHAEHLMEFGVTRHNNWNIVESQVIASIGILFPEYRRSADWRREGIQRLSQEIATQVYPDGVQWELSAGYHAMCGQGFASVYELAKLNDVKIPPVYEQRLRGMFDSVWQLARPDGSSPSHNDSNGIHGHFQAFVRRGARLFDDATMEWFGSGAARGTPPSTTSHGFRDAGLLVSRSGWRPDARWSLFDAGPYGAAHQHEDALGFEIYADGTLFLCDPGITSYMLEKWTYHQRDTASHNTIMLDGRPQARRANETPTQQVRSVRDEIFWASGEVADIARAVYRAGYRDLAGRFVHERALIFVRPDYWLLFDDVRDEAGGHEPHRIESRFQFTPMRLQADPGTGGVRTYRLGKPNLELVPLSDGRPPILRIACGQDDPVEGWVSDIGENLPAPCAVFSQQSQLPFRMGLVLYPFPTGASAPLTTQRLSTDGDSWAYELRHADGTSDLVCRAWTDGAVTRFAGYETDGWLAIIRRDASGQDTRAVVAGGTFLTRGGQPLDQISVEMLSGQ